MSRRADSFEVTLEDYARQQLFGTGRVIVGALFTVLRNEHGMEMWWPGTVRTQERDYTTVDLQRLRQHLFPDSRRRPVHLYPYDALTAALDPWVTDEPFWSVDRAKLDHPAEELLPFMPSATRNWLDEVLDLAETPPTVEDLLGENGLRYLLAAYQVIQQTVIFLVPDRHQRRELPQRVQHVAADVAAAGAKYLGVPLVLSELGNPMAPRMEHRAKALGVGIRGLVSPLDALTRLAASIPWERYAD